MSKRKPPPPVLQDFRYYQFEPSSAYYITISIPNTSIKITLDYQQPQGSGIDQHEKAVIRLSQPIDLEHARKVFEKFSRYNIVHGASDARGLRDEKFMYLIDELLGDLFYELNEEALNEELKAIMKLTDYKRSSAEQRIKELNYIISLIKFIKTKSPWRENYTRMREELEQTRGLLGFFMPKEEKQPKEDKQPTEEEEIVQADARAKQGAIKHREAQEKMRELMRSPEAESLRLQESEYPSVAEHILRAGRKTRRTKK